MLHASAVFLCLASFLQSFEPSKCRSTGRLPKDDNQTNHIITLCLEGCFLLTSSRQACLERCLRGRKELQGMLEDGGKRFSTSVILNPLLRRRKRNSAEYETDFSSLCSSNEVDVNVLPTIHPVQRHRYENSNTWYVNISWYPMDEARKNFTGYAVLFGYQTKNGTLQTGYFKRAKNETYLVYNVSENGWKVNYGDFFFKVITLPCLPGHFHLKKDLRDYLPSEDPATLSTGATTTNATTTSKSTTSTPKKSIRGATTTNATTTSKSTTSTPKKSIRVLIGGTVTFGGLVLITAMICVLRRKCHKESIVVAQRIPPAGFRYDAFIIFNQKDQKWVECKLLRILEDTYGFKCCVHYRDFEVGACFLNNISNSLEVSHKVIAVVSKNFFTSNWCNHELAEALYKQTKENDNSIIVIRKDDVTYDKLPVALRERSFIDYSNTVERKTWASKLVKALESNSNEESHGDDNSDIRLYSN